MDERALLLSYRGWLRNTAVDLLAGRPLHRAEDLAQEGWIAMWRAVQDDRDVAVKAPLDWWLKRQALLRMQQCVRDWFTPAKQRQHLLVDDVASLVELSTVLPVLELAYHRGEVYAAVGRLTPREREYVTLRFWGGANPAQLVDHFGYKPHGLWRTAAPKLALDLAHLAGAA
jgi:DNA-directed RNA polymerase specialized sigma24 family protein